jgi:predicted dehydrogenase
MGGGVLFDLGIYCLAPLLAFGGGEPESVTASAVFAPANEAVSTDRRVDSSFAGLLHFDNGLLASFSCSFDSAERQRLDLMGSAGSLAAERTFTPGWDETHYLWRGVDDVAQDRHTGGGEMYRPMIEEFASVVAGIAPPRHPLATTIAIARTVDRLRAAADVIALP